MPSAASHSPSRCSPTGQAGRLGCNRQVNTTESHAVPSRRPPQPPPLPALPLPHERDEATRGQVATQPDPVIAQAKRDLDAGMVDTDMRQTPGLDAKRRRQLVPTPTTPADKRR
jgi:hypothetical protein